MTTFMSWEELEASAHAKSESILEGVLPTTGIVLLVGAALVGKTRLLAALAAATTARHRTFAGQQLADVAGRPLLYALLEHSTSANHHTFRDAAQGVGLAKSNIYFARPPFDLTNEPDVSALLAKAQEIDAYAVVIDCLRRAGTHDETTRTKWRRC